MWWNIFIILSYPEKHVHSNVVANEDCGIYWVCQFSICFSTVV